VVFWAVYSRIVPQPAGLTSTLIHAVLLTAAFLSTLIALRAVRRDDLLELAAPVRRIFRRR